MDLEDLIGSSLDLEIDPRIEGAEERWLVNAYDSLKQSKNRPDIASPIFHALPIYCLCEKHPRDSRNWSMLGYCVTHAHNIEAAIPIFTLAARLGNEAAMRNAAILKEVAANLEGNCLSFLEPLLESENPLAEAAWRSRDNYAAALEEGDFEGTNYWLTKSVAFHFFNITPSSPSRSLDFTSDKETAAAVTEEHMVEVREKGHVLRARYPWAQMGYPLQIPQGFELYYGLRDTCNNNFHIKNLNALTSELWDKVRNIDDASPASPLTVLDIGYYAGKLTAHIGNQDDVAYTLVEANLPISNQLQFRLQKAKIGGEVIHADFRSDIDLGEREYDIVVALGIIGLCDEETLRKLLRGLISHARHLIIGDDISASRNNKCAMRSYSAGSILRFAHRYHDLLDEFGFEVVDCTPSKIIANYCNGFLVARKR